MQTKNRKERKAGQGLGMRLLIIYLYCTTHHSNKGFGQYTNYQLLYESVLCNMEIVNPAGVSSIQTRSVSVICDQSLNNAWKKPFTKITA